MVAKGGLRAFFSGEARAVGTRLHLGGGGGRLEHEVEVGKASSRLRFDLVDGGWHLRRRQLR